MRGLFVGRFQPLHNGHMSIIEEALDRSDELVVVVGSAESSFTPEDPFTAGERMHMLTETFREKGLNGRITPVPVRDLKRYSIWVDHVLSYIPSFDHVYTNNPLTALLFSARGFEVRSTPLVDRKKLSGVMIRKMIIDDDDGWRKLVPSQVENFIDEISGGDRLKAITLRGDER